MDPRLLTNIDASHYQRILADVRPFTARDHAIAIANTFAAYWVHTMKETMLIVAHVGAAHPEIEHILALLPGACERAVQDLLDHHKEQLKYHKACVANGKKRLKDVRKVK